MKIWGTATVVEGNEQQIAGLMPTGYRARPEQVIRFSVAACINCPQHIPQRFEAEDVSALLAARDERIHELQAELKLLKQANPSQGAPR